MPTFSTDDLPQKDRFDHWVEVRGRQLFGVTIELERAKRLDFKGAFSAVAIGGATPPEMQASTYHVRPHTRGYRADGERQSLCIAEQVTRAGVDGHRPRPDPRRHQRDAGGQPFGHALCGDPDADSTDFTFAHSRSPLRDGMLSPKARNLEHEPLTAGLRLTKLIAAGFAALVETGIRAQSGSGGANLAPARAADARRCAGSPRESRSAAARSASCCAGRL